MSRHGGTRFRATTKPIVVVAGEDRYDRQSLRILLNEFCPGIEGRIVEISDPIRLHSAKAELLAGRVKALAGKARARAARERAELQCVFVHEDIDQVDSEACAAARARVQQALARELGSAHYVLSVWEMEAWLLLFPTALASVTTSWKVPRQYLNRDTGTIPDPKRILLREVTKGNRPYRESDAPTVFAKAVALGTVHSPEGRNNSWEHFRSETDHCHRGHGPVNRSGQ